MPKILLAYDIDELLADDLSDLQSLGIEGVFSLDAEYDEPLLAFVLPFPKVRPLFRNLRAQMQGHLETDYSKKPRAC